MGKFYAFLPGVHALMVLTAGNELQMRSPPRNTNISDIDAPLDLPSTKNWRGQGNNRTLDQLRMS